METEQQPQLIDDANAISLTKPVSAPEKQTRKPKGLSDKDQIAKLTADVKAIKHMLHTMSSALGLPKSILPDLD